MADEDNSSKAIVQKLFPGELGEKLALAAGYGKRKDYRGVLEPTDPVTQCERSGNPFKADMPCYICGQPIPAKDRLTGPDDELYVECEHIFPVTEARWFLDIYMAKRPPEGEWTKKAVQMEYDQAHRVCNQAKSNDSFITVDASGTPTLNRAGINAILKKIKARASLHVNDHTDPSLNDIMVRIVNTVTTRTDVIAERVQKIIDHINSGVGGLPAGEQNMVLLMRTALMSDPEALPPAVKEIHDKWYRERPAALEEAERMFGIFTKETYDAYPQLKPENLGPLVYGSENLIIPAEYRATIDESSTTSALRKFFEATPPSDPSGRTVLSAVYYDIYQRTIERIPRGTELYCQLHNRLTAVSKSLPIVSTIFGPPPVRTEAEEAACAKIEQNKARELRAEEKGELPPSNPEEEANYFLEGIPDGEAKEMFLASENPESALRSLRTYSVEHGYTDTEGYKRIVTELNRLFLESSTPGKRRRSEAPTSRVTSPPSAKRRPASLGGGLRTRRPLYANVPSTVLASGYERDARLRKRTRARRTRRIRKQSRKSGRGGQRDVVGGV